MKRALVKNVMPVFAGELRLLLEKGERSDLAAKVDGLKLYERCRCGDDFCSTFYTAPPPDGSYGPGHSNLQLDPEVGMVIIDLVNDKIMCVEVLDRPDVQRELYAALP